jgi:hypothetical protein
MMMIMKMMMIMMMTSPRATFADTACHNTHFTIALTNEFFVETPTSPNVLQELDDTNTVLL